MENEHNRELDRIIERALGCYSDQPPPPAMEQRVLALVSEEGISRRTSRWLYTALAVAAALLLAVTNTWTERRSASETGLAARVPKVTVQEQPAPAHAQLATRPMRRSNRQHRSEPTTGERRVPLIPALTGEERALLVLAGHLASEPSTSFGEMPEPVIRPLEIPTIEIAPLQSDGHQ